MSSFGQAIFKEYLIVLSLQSDKLSIRDVDLLTIGMVNDMYAENRKKYKEIATHKDFDII